MPEYLRESWSGRGGNGGGEDSPAEATSVVLEALLNEGLLDLPGESWLCRGGKGGGEVSSAKGTSIVLEALLKDGLVGGRYGRDGDNPTIEPATVVLELLPNDGGGLLGRSGGEDSLCWRGSEAESRHSCFTLYASQACLR